MNPEDPTSYNHCYTWNNGIRYHHVDEGPKDGPAMVFFHGYPDFWYGWRYQIPHFAKLGYRCIVPDLRGYNESLHPHIGHSASSDEQLKAFALPNLCKDITDLLDSLGYKGKKVIIVGHDWGGWFAWRFVQMHPERVRGVAVLCTAYTAPNKNYVSTAKLAEIYPNWMYQVFFNHPTAESQLLASTPLYFTLTMRGAADPLPDSLRVQQYTPSSWSLAGKTPEDVGLTRSSMLSAKELDAYIAAYRKAGFQGGLNWYRVRHLNHTHESQLNPVIDQFPALMVTAGKDPALSPAMAKRMPGLVKKLKMEHIEEGGHWLQVEHAAQVNGMIESWLACQVEGKGKAKL